VELETLIINLVTLILGVTLGSWIGSEVAIRRVSKSARRIIEKVLEDSQTKLMIRQTAEDFVRHMIKVARKELNKKAANTVEGEELLLPDIEDYAESI
jgi:gas vesicle protein